MANALAGNFVRAEDIVDTMAATVTSDTSICTAASGFTVTLQEASTYGKLVSIRINVTSTNALTQPTAGNLTDITICTLDVGYRPVIQQSFTTYGGIAVAGYIQTSGAVRLANADNNVAAGAGLELGVTYLVP